MTERSDRDIFTPKSDRECSQKSELLLLLGETGLGWELRMESFFDRIEQGRVIR